MPFGHPYALRSMQTPPPSNRRTRGAIRAHHAPSGISGSIQWDTSTHEHTNTIQSAAATGRGTRSYSTIKCHSSRGNHLMKGCPVNVSNYTNAGYMRTVPGQQSVNVIDNPYVYIDWNRAVDIGAAQGPAFDQRRPGVAPDKILYQERAVLRSIKYSLELKNNSGDQLQFTIYECQAKRDSNKGPVSCWADDNNTQATKTRGGIAEGASNTYTPQQIGAVPEDSAEFKRQWKVCRKTHYTMGPGDLHDHTLYYSNPKPMMRSDWLLTETDETISNFKKGYSMCIFLILRGVPARVDTGVDSSVTTGGPRLDFVKHVIQKSQYNIQDAFGPAKYDHYTLQNPTDTVETDQPVSFLHNN